MLLGSPACRRRLLVVLVFWGGAPLRPPRWPPFSALCLNVLFSRCTGHAGAAGGCASPPALATTLLQNGALIAREAPVLAAACGGPLGVVSDETAGLLLSNALSTRMLTQKFAVTA